MAECEVIIKDCGCVFRGNRAQAEQTFLVYKSVSRMPASRYFGKVIDLYVGGVLKRSWQCGESFAESLRRMG